jgi:Ribbon-helix-helix domain
MPKEKRMNRSEQGEARQATKFTRTTIFMTDVLNHNLDAFALTTGEAKGEIVRKAVSEYLEKHGFTPNKRPKITISY